MLENRFIKENIRLDNRFTNDNVTSKNRFVLVNKDMTPLDRIVLNGEIHEVYSVCKDSVAYVKNGSVRYITLERLKQRCSFVVKILDRMY